jgi:hypothetical protein
MSAQARSLLLDEDEHPANGVWRRLVARLVEEGEPLANALKIADTIERRRSLVEATRDAADPRPGDR